MHTQLNGFKLPQKINLPLMMNRNFSPEKLIHRSPIPTYRKTRSPAPNEVINSHLFVTDPTPQLNQSEKQLEERFNFFTSNMTLPGLSKIKSSDIIKHNKKTKFYTQQYKILSIEQRKRKKNLAQAISKETKKLIYLDKLEKLKANLDKKINKGYFERLEYEKKKFIKTFFTLFTIIVYSRNIRNEFITVRSYRKKIHDYIFKVYAICKAIGKFLRLLNIVRVKFSMQKLKRLMPRYINSFKSWVKSKYTLKIEAVINNFFKYGSISRVNHMINFQLKMIQRTVRHFLTTMRHRKYCVWLLWKNLDTQKGVIYEFIQYHYISIYIIEKLKKFVSAKKKFKKFSTFLTSGFIPLDFEFSILEDYDEPVVRIYDRLSVRKVINKAYNNKQEWKNIKFFRVIKLGNSENGVSLNSILKRGRNIGVRRVTFKH